MLKNLLTLKNIIEENIKSNGNISSNLILNLYKFSKTILINQKSCAKKIKKKQILSQF